MADKIHIWVFVNLARICQSMNLQPTRTKCLSTPFQLNTQICSNLKINLGELKFIIKRHWVFLKAMAETGQVTLYGDHPTLTECSLYRARRHIYKEERLQAEQEKLEKIGPMAYYSEWVEAWKRDTSREAVQKHFEETGEDENTQLIEMFMHQTDLGGSNFVVEDLKVKVANDKAGGEFTVSSAEVLCSFHISFV